MATHSSVPDWRIQGTGELGGLLSMGSHRVGHDWSDLAAAAAAINIYQIDRVNKLMPRNISKLNWQNCSEYSGSLFFCLHG